MSDNDNMVMYDDDMQPAQKAKTGGLPGWVDWLLRFYVMLMVPFLLVVGGSRLVMSPAFLIFEYNHLPERSYSYEVGMSREGRIEYGPYGVLYIINNEPISYLAELELPGDLCFPQSTEPCVAFNEGELKHMEDVQVVAQGLFTAGFWNALIVLGVGLVLWWGVGLQALRLGLMQGALLTLGLIFTGVLLAVTAWDFFFTQFHNVFFEPGTWRFYYSDTLIRLYPERFWFEASLVLGGLTVLGALVILGISWWMPVGQRQAQ